MTIVNKIKNSPRLCPNFPPPQHLLRFFVLFFNCFQQGTFVLKVTATDQDKLNAPVTYEIFDRKYQEHLYMKTITEQSHQ